MKKRIAVLGSTGSIGRQTLEVIGNHPGEFELVAITAGKNIDLLIEQALKYLPQYVVIADEKKYRDVHDALSAKPIEVMTGSKSLAEVAGQSNADMVVTAMVGYAGLLPTVEALRAGKDIALANKETMVVAGEYITCLADQNKSKIIPVDSEHSAIFQCLAGETGNQIEKIILTASGGPFREKTYEELKNVTKKEALLHPNWCMGDKITIDSATMMNKGLEVIEARWLFNLSFDQIEVIIHPQSIIHSIVQFADGSMKAQMGMPDMRVPIQYALGYPRRLISDFPRFNFANYPALTFHKPDTSIFRNLELAYLALKRGGNMPCILNAANEVVVEAFLNETVKFLEIPEIIENVMNKLIYIPHPSLEDYSDSDHEARQVTLELIGN
ncbi:MAG TPA: 1-deoxy-D-xylulose-5-phosphate reductoisomerase [Bacteroidales bacterium]|nr:1-deoxy-D-xylulose-5-phosphate reductoisomerase [Bacteroidales bacterium]